jgi:hypothetical protein
MTLASALVGAAVGVGVMHTSAPDHWVPFAALARAERWSARRTAAITALCGLGHVSVSAALGLLALVFGRELFQAFGERLESVSGLLLLGFGVAYGLWGLRNAMAARIRERAPGFAHAHGHRHAHHDADPRALTPLTLFLLFSADPCVAVVPLVFASAPLGWLGTLAVVLAYEIATIGTMVLFVLPARAVAGAVRGAWTDRYGEAFAGGVVAAVGLLVVSFGL